MDKNKHALWVEKHRPKTLAQYTFHDAGHRTAFEGMVRDGTIPHLLLSGVQGTGKTTLALILINELHIDDTDVLTINASDENNVDVIRDKIKMFVTSYAMGDFKIVHLEEADYISPAGQAIMRRLMEEYSDNARFILTCNYENKIIPPLRSRFSVGHYRFKKHDIDEVAFYAAKVLKTEGVKFDLDLLDRYVRAGYPDIRTVINLLQKNSRDGVLAPMRDVSETNDYKFALLEHLQKDDWFGARKLTCAEVAAEEWEDVYRFLYENLEKCPKFSVPDKWEEGIIVVADHLYKHALCADPEINAAAMYIRLAQL